MTNSLKEKILTSLSKKNFDIDYNLQFSLWNNAIVDNDLNCVAFLLSIPSLKPSILSNKPFRECVIYANKYNSYDIAKLLLSDHRVDPAALDNQAFKTAALYNDFTLLSLIIEDYRCNTQKQLINLLNDFLANNYKNYKELFLFILPYVSKNGISGTEYTFEIAYNNNLHDIVNILWKNIVIKENLKIKNTVLYQKLFKEKVKSNLSNFG